MHRTNTPSPHHRSLVVLGLVAGLFLLGTFMARPRRPRMRQPRLREHEYLPTRSSPPAPTALLLASVAGEEDPGAAVDAPAPPPHSN